MLLKEIKIILDIRCKLCYTLDIAKAICQKGVNMFSYILNNWFGIGISTRRKTARKYIKTVRDKYTTYYDEN